MFKLENVRHCMWRNAYSPRPVLAGTISFGDAFEWTTRRLSPAVLSVFKEKLSGAVPESGHLAAPDFVASLAQHIQLLGDDTTAVWGVGWRDNAKRTADIFFSCRDLVIATQSFSLAAQIADRLANSDLTRDRLSEMLKSCEDVIARSALELRTRLMVEAAEGLGIPWFRTNGLVRHVQLGQGHRQRRMWKTMFGDEPVYARDYARNKVLTMATLSQIMLPVGQYAPVRDIASALKSADEIGYPLVLKPVDGGKGDSVYVDLRDEAELKAALTAARINERPFMLQSFFPGDDHRLLGGGIVKTGLYVDRCDVAALLNVQREQIEMDGIETLDDMVALKRKVLDVARKAVVLNADDPRCLALASEFRPSLRTILFSRSSNSAAIREHLAGGADALFLAEKDGREMIIVASGSDEVRLLATADVPATNGGLIWFHGTNAMAAAALAIGLGIEVDAIRAGLRRYGREYSAAALRAVFAEGFPMRVMFDSSGKAPGYAAAVTVTDAIKVAGKRICVITLPGNRPDWAFVDAAAALAGHFDRYICFEREEYRRGRKPGEIPARLADALIAAGVSPSAVFLAGPHKDAAKRVAEQATEQDFVVVFATDSPATVEEYRSVLCGMRSPA